MISNLPRIVLLMVLVLPAAATADVYRWVDDQGVAHYSDQPTGDAQAVDIRSAGTAKGAPAAREAQQDEQPDVAPTADGEGADDAAAKARVRADQCAKAKDRLTKLRNAQRILVKEDNGKQRELSPDEQVDEIVRAEDRVDSLCGSGAAPGSSS